MPNSDRLNAALEVFGSFSQIQRNSALLDFLTAH
jgi:hypothetical protein